MNGNTNIRLSDTLTERAICFHAGGREFALYPPSIGKLYLTAPIVEGLGINGKLLSANLYLEMMRICHEKRDAVCLLISYYSFYRKRDLLNDAEVNSRKKFFSRELDDKELSTLLSLIFTYEDIEGLKSELGITQDNEKRRKIYAIKKNNSHSVSVGGVSIYGRLIDFACQRYGWTFDYTVWGISRANIELLVADAIESIYLDADERKELHIPCGEVINADDPRNNELLIKMFNG